MRLRWSHPWHATLAIITIVLAAFLLYRLSLNLAPLVLACLLSPQVGLSDRDPFAPRPVANPRPRPAYD